MSGAPPLGNHQAILIVLGDDVTDALSRPARVNEDLVNEHFDPTWVHKPEELAAKLKQKWDLVVTGPANLDVVAATQDPKNILLISMGATKQQEKEAKKKYSWVVTKVASEDFIEDVADALEAKAKAAKSAKNVKLTRG